ncbi:MAG: PAC2 family protein [Candidatus Woesearchaeota archaeon]
MKIELWKKPQNVTIIEGFPGFGLVGTISTEFLLDHLETVKIGSIWFSEMNPIVAVHDKKVIDPLGIFYNKKYNLVILHTITNIKGVEWKLANVLEEMAKKLKAKEVISIEGVGAVGKEKGGCEAYYYSKIKSKKWDKVGIKPLEEGIIMGVSASLLLKADKVPISCIFAETKTGLPDSRAAAKIIEVLDKYLGLGVDYKPLLKKAEQFEEKIKTIVKKANVVKTNSEEREISYMG